MSEPAGSLRWMTLGCSIVAACANSEPPARQPVVPVVTIPFAYQVTPEPADPVPGDPLMGNDANEQPSQHDVGVAVETHRTTSDAQCTFYIVGDPEQKAYTRRILALAEAWRKGLDIRSVEMSCYILRINVPPDIKP